MSRIPRIILLIEDSHEFGRSLMRGIGRYSRMNGPWIFFKDAPFYYEHYTQKERLKRLKEWKADGIIMREQGDFDDEILSLGLPTVYSAWRNKPIDGIPNLICDDIMVGKMGADYFIERGFRNFAFCGYDEFFWSIIRGESFAQQLRKQGFNCHVFKQDCSPARRKWGQELPKLVKWLQSLPRPLALMTCTDDRSWQITDACRLAELHVPEDVAILGVNNDPLICDLATPPLSSITLNGENAGYQSAALLDKMMNGYDASNAMIDVLPSGIITRQSSDIFAIEDPLIAKALSYIRAHCREPIHVDDIASEFGLSRRLLEQRFKKQVNRSVYKELLNMRMQAAAEMLLNTNFSISRIAESVGYEELKYFSRAFRNIFGLSPLAYRRRHAGMK